MYRWKPIFNLKVHDPLCLSTEHRIAWNEKPTGTIPSHGGKGALEVVNSFHFHRIHCHAECWSRRLCILQLKWIRRIGWIPQDGDPGKFGHDLLEQFQSLRAYIHSSVGEPCDIPARARQARHNSSSDGIAARHDNGDRGGC